MDFLGDPHHVKHWEGYHLFHQNPESHSAKKTTTKCQIKQIIFGNLTNEFTTPTVNQILFAVTCNLF
jgi:hypothetical protein